MSEFPPLMEGASRLSMCVMVNDFDDYESFPMTSIFPDQILTTSIIHITIRLPPASNSCLTF